MEERALKFYHQTFTLDIENEFYSTKITIETQEMMNSLTRQMLDKVAREKIVFANGEESHDFANEFVDACEDKLEDAEDLSDQFMFHFITLHSTAIVSYLWGELDFHQHRGHERFECGFSEVHGFQEENVCEHCRPLLRRSVVRA